MEKDTLQVSLQKNWLFEHLLIPMSFSTVPGSLASYNIVNDGWMNCLLGEGKRVNNRSASYKQWWYNMDRFLPAVSVQSLGRRGNSSYLCVGAILEDFTSRTCKWAKSFMNVSIRLMDAGLPFCSWRTRNRVHSKKKQFVAQRWARLKML